MRLPTPPPSPYYPLAAFVPISAVAVLYSLIASITLWSIGKSPPITPLPSQQTRSKKKKVAIITGSNTGIGFETAKTLVEHGFTVIMACRSRSKALEAIERIGEGSSSAIFEEPVDLASLESVRSFSKTILEKYEFIDVLINNAGINTSGVSQDGFDLCFQANFLGHFVLTNELLPKLGRVVNLSSVMHHYVGMGHRDYNYWRQCALPDAPFGSTYASSKLAMLLLSVALQERGVDSIAVNPGAVNSDIWRALPRFLIPILGMIFLTTQQGSYCSVAAALWSAPEKVIYMSPYWQPFNDRDLLLCETLGPFVGWRVTKPRLVAGGGVTDAEALWRAARDLTAK